VLPLPLPFGFGTMLLPVLLRFLASLIITSATPFNRLHVPTNLLAEYFGFADGFTMATVQAAFVSMLNRLLALSLYRVASTCSRARCRARSTPIRSLVSTVRLLLVLLRICSRH
jgi:hypothetical protein